MCSVFLDAQGVMYSAAQPPSSKWVTVRSLQPSEVVQFKKMAQLIFLTPLMEKDNLFYYIFALLLDAVCAHLTLKQAQLTKLAEY